MERIDELASEIKATKDDLAELCEAVEGRHTLRGVIERLGPRKAPDGDTQRAIACLADVAADFAAILDRLVTDDTCRHRAWERLEECVGWAIRGATVPAGPLDGLGRNGGGAV